MYWKEIFILVYFSSIAFFDGKIIINRNILENVIPLLLINPIVFLCTKYVNDSIFGPNFICFNMAIITSVLLLSNINDELYNTFKKICFSENGEHYVTFQPPIAILLIFGIWCVYNLDKTFGLMLITLLLKFKIYIMKSDIDEYIYQYLSNGRNICNTSYDINDESILYPIDEYCYNIDSPMNKIVYKTTTYVYKLCIFKFWIFLICSYIYYTNPSISALYMMTITHSLYILSVLKLHYLLNKETMCNRLNIKINLSDIFFSNLTNK